MASSLSFNLQAPRPPSPKETNEDPDRTLRWLSDRIAELYSLDDSEPDPNNITKSTASAYLDIYNAVHSYVIATRCSSRARGGLNGDELYHGLEGAIKNYCQQNREQIDAAPKVLPAYVERWTIFLEVSRRTERLFRFLERHWIRREVDEKTEGIFELRELHLRTWKEEVLGDGSVKIVDAMVQLQQQDQSRMEVEDRRFLEESTASLSQLGLVLSDGSLVAMET